ncbi:hypothetical protein [Streptomyces sp. NPDC051561]|uniref:hypothetical protein n=1 Tax=Streptomyces sp. NPDC051561 TaxID=3365658 RepID=UPI00379C76BF
MNSKQYREQAESLLTAHPRWDLNPDYIAQAAVWAQLATAAALTETRTAQNTTAPAPADLKSGAAA